MIEARIDVVSPAGVVEGWARCASRTGPVQVTLWLDGLLVGVATALAFRRDLLAAGIGHGHYAYRCKMRASGPAHGLLELREAGGDVALASYVIAPDSPVKTRRAKRRTIESLLVLPPRWSIEDVAEHLDVLDLQTNLLELGPKRFVAMAYRFLLDRWPGEGEYDFYQPDICRDLLSASDIFKTILNSQERRNSGLEPLSPFDPGYPFLVSLDEPERFAASLA